MKNRLYIQLNFILLLVIAFSSCEKDVGPIRIRPLVPYDSTSYRISFSNYIQPIFNENCIGCHNATHPFLNLHASVSFDELLYTGDKAPYIDSIEPENSLLIQRLRGVEWPIMPPNPPHVSEANIDSIKLWMMQGCYYN